MEKDKSHQEFLREELRDEQERHENEIAEQKQEAVQEEQRRIDLETKLQQALERLETAEQKSEQYRAEAESIAKEKDALVAELETYRESSSKFTEYFELLLFDEKVGPSEVAKVMPMLDKIALAPTNLIYDFPVTLTREQAARESTQWVLSTRDFRDTAKYMDLSVNLLLIPFMSRVLVQPEHFSVLSMLEAISLKAKNSEIELDDAAKLGRFLDQYLFDMPESESLSLIEARLVEIIFTCATRSGRTWRPMQQVCDKWEQRLDKLSGPRAHLFMAYSAWFRSMILEQVATLPDLICSLAPDERKATELDTGRVMLGSVIAGRHVVVNLEERQIAMFNAKDHGVAYSLCTRLVDLPERRMCNGDFIVPDPFFMPSLDCHLIHYATDIFFLAPEDFSAGAE